MAVPDAAAAVFGDAAGLAERYVELLSTAGVERGLLGPREVGRLWDRHVLNSVAAASEVPDGVRVVDVGSGAGLPGIPLALARSDLHVTLLEPLARRAAFLTEVVEDLGIGDRVRVVRGRASGAGGRDPLDHHDTYDVVTARAVAPLPRLLRWTVPLLASGRRGRLVALKGASAADEVADAAADLKRFRLRARVVAALPHADAEPTHLIVCTRA